MSTWHNLMQRHSTQPLQSPVVCKIVEEMALALPDVAQGEPAWSPLDDTGETDSDQQHPLPSASPFALSQNTP